MLVDVHYLSVQATTMINYVHEVIQWVEIDKVLQEVIKDETLIHVCEYFMLKGGQACRNLTSLLQWQFLMCLMKINGLVQLILL